MVVATRRRHYLGAIGVGKLHRQVADTAGTGQDQHPLPRLEGTVFKQSLPGGEARQRQRRPCLKPISSSLTSSSSRATTDSP